MRLEVVDCNDDGVADLLIGSHLGNILFFEGYEFGFTGITCPAPGNHGLVWSSADFLSYTLLAGDSPDDINTVVAAEIPSAGTSTTWNEHSLEPRRFYRVIVVDP